MVNTSKTRRMNCISSEEHGVLALRNEVKANSITIDSLAGEKRQRRTLYSKADNSRIEWSKFGCSVFVVDHVTPGFRFAPDA